MKIQNPSPHVPTYPHIVVRWVATVYAHRDVHFAPPPEHDPEHPDFDLYVDLPEPADRRCLNPGERAAIVNVALHRPLYARFRRCVVFGPDDVVYVEPDGSTDTGVRPPSGGLRL